jgi:hypothetical protein
MDYALLFVELFGEHYSPSGPLLAFWSFGMYSDMTFSCDVTPLVPQPMDLSTHIYVEGLPDDERVSRDTSREHFIKCPT